MNTRFLLASCFFCFCFFFPIFSDMSINVEKQGKPAGLAVNTPNSDMFVTEQVRQALSLYKNYSSVTVSAKDGVVTLTGTVSDEEAKTTIGGIVAKVPGVKSVDNKLEVLK